MDHDDGEALPSNTGLRRQGGKVKWRDGNKPASPAAAQHGGQEPLDGNATDQANLVVTVNGVYKPGDNILGTSAAETLRGTSFGEFIFGRAARM